MIEIMVHLIDKSALVAEINKLKGKVDDESSYCNGWQHALRMLEIEFNTLEVKEVDLEKELDAMITPELKFHKTLPSLFDVAKHFFELGLRVNGYHQAEKDNELTWEDMRELYIIFADVDVGIELCKTDIQAETIGYYQEVLKRFKDFKERKEK